MAERKREREETEVGAAVQELESCLARDPEIKLQALGTVTALVDSKDEAYVAQREAAGLGVLNSLMALLEDDSAAVRVAAANALVTLAGHSSGAKSRLAVGKTTGFSHTPEKVLLNPVQEEVSELEGVFTLLVNMRFSDDPELQAAGDAALSAVCALNRPNTLAMLRELVRRLLSHEPKALEALEGMLAGLDVRDDMAVLLDQALSPALTFLRNGEPSEQLDAATLLGSICEKRPGAAAFLVAEGALAPVTKLVVSGDLATADVATHTLWLLVKDNKKLLSPSKEALGLPGPQLVEPLLALVEATEEAIASADEDDMDDDDDEEEAEEEVVVEGQGGAAKNGTAKAGGGAGSIADKPLAVDNGDDALLLLRALAGQDEEVRDKLKGQSEILGTRCSIM